MKNMKGLIEVAIQRKSDERPMRGDTGHGRSSRRRWTADEDGLLQEHFGKVTPRAMLILLPGRSWESIRRRAYDMGKAAVAGEGNDAPDRWGKRWSEAEVRFLRALLRRGEPSDVDLSTALPGRSLNAIRHQIRFIRRSDVSPSTHCEALPTQASVTITQDGQIAIDSPAVARVPPDVAEEIVARTEAIRSSIATVAAEHGLDVALAPVLANAEEIDSLVIERL